MLLDDEAPFDVALVEDALVEEVLFDDESLLDEDDLLSPEGSEPEPERESVR